MEARSKRCNSLPEESLHTRIHTYPESNRQPIEVTESKCELTFPCSLKEEPDNKHLQPSHTYHQPTFHTAEVEYPSLRTFHGAEVAILARPEVFLVPVNCG